MKPGKLAALALVGATVGALVGVVQKQLAPSGSEIDDAPGYIQNTLPDFHYPDLEKHIRYSNEWKDSYLVLNFWASWCPPCKNEAALFNRLGTEYAGKPVKFVGIALDDQEPVEEFVESHGMKYPVLLGDVKTIDIAHKLGNRFDNLPFTVIAGPDGRIILRNQGEISEETLRSTLESHLVNPPVN